MWRFRSDIVRLIAFSRPEDPVQDAASLLCRSSGLLSSHVILRRQEAFLRLF